MITVLIKTESHYAVNRKRVRETVEQFLKEKGIKGNAEVSISVVGNRLMRKLNREYRKIDEPTDVISFPLALGEMKTPFVDPPDNILRLGDIVVSYPEAVNEAVEEDKMMDEKIDELVIHGLEHLLGHHHD